jgi:hypothetical protein
MDEGSFTNVWMFDIDEGFIVQDTELGVTQ